MSSSARSALSSIFLLLIPFAFHCRILREVRETRNLGTGGLAPSGLPEGLGLGGAGEAGPGGVPEGLRTGPVIEVDEEEEVSSTWQTGDRQTGVTLGTDTEPELSRLAAGLVGEIEEALGVEVGGS